MNVDERVRSGGDQRRVEAHAPGRRQPHEHAADRKVAPQAGKRIPGGGRGANRAPSCRFDPLGDHYPATARAFVATASRNSTMRGPHLEATSSLTPTTPPLCTAAIVLQPARAATLAAVWPQHFVSASTIRSGFAATMYSAESFGYPETLLSAASAMSLAQQLQGRPPRVPRSPVVVGAQLLVEVARSPRHRGDRLRDPALHPRDDLAAPGCGRSPAHCVIARRRRQPVPAGRGSPGSSACRALPTRLPNRLRYDQSVR